MILISLTFKMIFMIVLGLLVATCAADLVPQRNPTFFDNDTVLVPNVHGEMVLHTIVDLIWEIDIPDAPDKINITGPASKVIDYINTNYPHYVWPDVDELNTTSSGKELSSLASKPICNVFGLTPYPVASTAKRNLDQLGNHYFQLGPGPRTCAQAECKEDLNGRYGAIWWCNDGHTPAYAKAVEIAALAQVIIPNCAEFAVPLTYTRGQIFDDSRPYNVIVTGHEKCR